MEPSDLANLNLDAARQFVAELPAEIRRRGTQLVADGAVKELRCDNPGTEIVADIEAETLLRTTLRYDAETQFWWEECSCPAGGGCEHAAAAMLTLVAEQESQRRPSAGKRPTRKAVAALPPNGELFQLVGRSLNRELSRLEAVYVNRLEERFYQLKERPYLNGDDLIGFGFKISDNNTWEKLDLWPSMPRSPLEFWHYVALAAEERGLAWPEFLRGVTELESTRERLTVWRRQREVERWRNLLNNLQLTPAEESKAGDDLELRLRLGLTETWVEYRRPGALDFTSIKPTKFREFDEKYGEQLGTEGSQLWQPLIQRARHGQPVSLNYDDAQTRRLLNRLLRNIVLRSLIFGNEGDLLVWEPEPLRWNLAMAEDDDDDYHLRLVKPDGQPAPKAVMVLSGRPTLYVTPISVWVSPPIEDRALDPVAETRIPARSLETAAGIRFLQHHGIALPTRIESRVQKVALKPQVRGELRAISFGNETEYAVVDVVGCNGDGSYQERWNGAAWIQVRPGTEPEARAAGEEPLATYDRGPLADLPRTLEQTGFKWDFARQRWLLRVTAKFPDQFMAWVQSLPSGIDLDLKGELGSFQHSVVAGQVRLEVIEAEMDWFDLKVVLDVTDTQLTPEEIKLLLDARGRWVRLGNKGWRKLEFKLTPEEDAQFARLGLNPRELGSEPQRLHALQLGDPSAKALVGAAAYARIERRVSEIQSRVTPAPPGSLNADLRPYQLEGYHFLCYLAVNGFGGILADDMGLGKTLQTLAWIAWLVERRCPEVRRDGVGNPGPERKHFLVICPKSVTDNWRAEAARFVPNLPVRVWSGEKLKDLGDDSGPGVLHVINYNQLRVAGEALSKLEFHAIILDEGQYIKNPTSITAQLARGLRATHRLVLSGTPIENKLLDLWSLMSFAVPGALGARAEFQRLFDQKNDPLARQRLAARVRPFLLRRTKAQVARDLPDRIEEDLFCELEGEQKSLYRAELKRAQGMLLRVNSPSTLNKHRFNFLTSLLRLRQICCDARLTKPDAKGDSAKLEALLETIEPILEEGQKVLVFSQFVEMLELLRSSITERGWSHYFLSGATEGRGDLVRQFQAHEGGAVFLISLKAGGFGLNLTAASYVVLFDPWWNPAVEAQAIDRTHRIGQTQKVIAYRLLIKNSVEEKIRALQKQKSKLAEDVLGEETFSQSLTLDDLRFLLSD